MQQRHALTSLFSPRNPRNHEQNAGRMPLFTRLAGRLATRARRALANYRSRPTIRVLTLNDPEAFVDRPGERRIIFNNRVIVVTKR